jgi:hypothetical protein
MNWQVEIRGENRVEESEMMLRVLRSKSDWPRSARQLGQRSPNDNKAGGCTATTWSCVEERGFRAGSTMSHQLLIDHE